MRANQGYVPWDYGKSDLTENAKSIRDTQL